MAGRARRSWPTWLLLALCAGCAALTTASAARSVLIVIGVDAVDPALTASARERAASQGATGLIGPLDAGGLRVAEGISLLVSLPAALLCLALLLGVATWRTWALDTVLGVYGITGALLVVFAGAGLVNDAPNAALGLLGGLAALGVAGLAVCPPVRADADRVRIAGEVQERHRLTALRDRS